MPEAVKIIVQGAMLNGVKNIANNKKMKHLHAQDLDVATVNLQGVKNTQN